jgi:hypothetical protein
MERQKIVRLLVKEILVGEDTITIRHSIPIPSGPPQNGGTEPLTGQNYLLCKGRERFTLAHEIGHFVLPGQQEVSAPCKHQRIENWDADLYRPELEANRFAAEILMPRGIMAEFCQSEPSLESIRSIAKLCGTSLTASAVRLITLTPHRAAVVWSQDQKILWSKLSEGFVPWIRKGDVRENSFAAQCYRKQSVPDQRASVPCFGMAA